MQRSRSATRRDALTSFAIVISYLSGSNGERHSPRGVLMPIPYAPTKTVCSQPFFNYFFQSTNFRWTSQARNVEDLAVLIILTLSLSAKALALFHLHSHRWLCGSNLASQEKLLLELECLAFMWPPLRVSLPLNTPYTSNATHQPRYLWKP